MPVLVHSREIYQSAHDVNASDWNQLLDEQNIYLSLDYLQSIEDSMSDTIDFFYSISYNQAMKPILISTFQLVTFIDKRKHTGNRFSCVISKLKSRLFTFNLLVCGNVFSNGENGYIKNDTLSFNECLKELTGISNSIKSQFKERKKQASIVLFKEFWANDNQVRSTFLNDKFREFMIDVNMVVSIKDSWKSMDDYRLSLKAKYRTKVNSVFKKSSKHTILDLSKSDILKYSERINELFKNVTDKSNFSVGQLKATSFFNLKEALGDQFYMRGIFDGDDLLGFSTGTFNRHILEANYVGLDYKYNQSNAVYQRLLYDYVEQAIVSQSKELHLGRTSELIKSGLGAVPENMNLYAKHNNFLRNSILKHIFHFISPSKFELRQPFKTTANN